MRYVHTKATKRMESYRVRSTGQDRCPTLLLPVSLGVSSVVLLHLLDAQLHTQAERMNRTGYALHVLHVDSSDSESDAVTSDALLTAVKQHYPAHNYSSARLADVFCYSTASLLKVPGLDLSSQGDSSQATDQEQLASLISSLPSATSRSDVLAILKTRLVMAKAMELDCIGVLWGDSTTRLAEKTLAETAKGRGFSLPWQLSDGSSPHGLNFHYPLRDLLKKELVTFSSLTIPPLTSLILDSPAVMHVSASGKNTTVDDLMTEYFESVEQNYPSIVANVVRTSGKLKAPRTDADDDTCSLCAMPLAHGSAGLHGWGGDQEALETGPSHLAGDDSGEGSLCYGCARSLLGSKSIRTS